MGRGSPVGTGYGCDPSVVLPVAVVASALSVMPLTSPSRPTPSAARPPPPSGQPHADRPGRGRRGITTGLTEAADAATAIVRTTLGPEEPRRPPRRPHPG